MNPMVIKGIRIAVGIGAFVLPMVDDHFKNKAMEKFIDETVAKKVAEAMKNK